MFDCTEMDEPERVIRQQILDLKREKTVINRLVMNVPVSFESSAERNMFTDNREDLEK